jgi:diamine N-acetyltransferase
MSEVRIAAVTAADVERLCALAAEIWRRHYVDIIGVAQIDYMLAQRYVPSIVQAELRAGNIGWDQLQFAGRMAGFVSYFPGDGPGVMKLDKLYVHHDYQRRGHGGKLIDHVVAIARTRHCETLMLAVNKRNVNAMAAYAKYGFHVAESVVKDIGGGYVMDDYVMVRKL